VRDFLNRVFTPRQSGESSAEPTAYDVQVATAALLIEVAGADDEFSDEEREALVSVLRDSFGLKRDEVDEIITAANLALEQKTDLYFFTNQINAHFDTEHKIRIIEMVWRVIFADKRLHGREDHLAHRFALLLRLDHTQLIQAKQRTRKALDVEM
jgi:uncharacterized tellurite resistance protein B-like protein